MNSDRAAAINNVTQIADLNFDCLLNIFKNLGLLDLCAVADVCTFWRDAACAVYGLKNSLKVHSDYCDPQEFASVILRRTSQIVRNFGSRTTAIEIKGSCHDLSLYEQRNYQLRLVHVLGKHCDGTLNELNLYRFFLSRRTVRFMEPLLRCVNKLKIHDCETGEFNLKILRRYAPMLEELTFVCNLIDVSYRFEDWRHSIPSMTSLSFSGINIANSDIRQILLMNPQLTKIKFEHCRNVDDTVIELVARNGPQISALHFLNTGSRPSTARNIRWLGQMRNLRTLELGGFEGMYKSIVHEIGVAAIPIEHLHLNMSWRDPHHNPTQLVAELTTLQSLKTLRLDNCNHLNSEHIREVCFLLHNLSELHLSYSFFDRFELDLSVNQLKEFIRHAENLNRINFRGFRLKHDAHIDSNSFMEIVNIIEQRRKKSCVELDLDVDTIVSNIPIGLASEHKHLLKIHVH